MTDYEILTQISEHY